MESRKNRTAIYQIAAYAAPICSVLIWYGMGEKEERRESVRKTSCRTNDRINVATTSYKDAARTWTDGFGKGNCTGKRNIVYSIFGWHGD